MENNYDYSYVGFICVDNNNKPVLLTKTGNKYNICGIVGSNIQRRIEITEHEAMVVGVKFFDGTESVTIEYAHNKNYVDILFVIESYGGIENENDLSIFDMIYKDFEGLNFFWDFVEEYFETDEGMENFEKFVKKDNWNKINK